MTGHKVAAKNDFKNADVLRKTPYMFMGKWCVGFECGSGQVWDGKPMDFSCYA
jgi:hypothetical protein